MSEATVESLRPDGPTFADAELVEEWRYAPDPTDREQAIGRPGWIVRAPSGRVFVLDTEANRVVRLTSAGRYDGFFGRGGRGTGELMIPSALRMGAEGEVAVLDEGRNCVVCFTEAGAHLRDVPLGARITRARDLLVLPTGEMLVSGVAAGSTHAIHRFGADGEDRGGLGELRVDLEDPVLRERYSDGALALLPDGRIAYAQRTPFRLQVFRDGECEVDHTDPRIVSDYVHEVATRDGARWRFDWRHPSLTTFLPLPGGCFLVGVQVPPPDTSAPPAAFRTILFVLDAAGEIRSETRLDRFLWPTQLWTEGGTHLLGFGIFADTQTPTPVQYRLRGS